MNSKRSRCSKHGLLKPFFICKRFKRKKVWACRIHQKLHDDGISVTVWFTLLWTSKMMKTNSGGRRLHINNSFLSFRIKAELNPSPTPLCLTKETVSCKKTQTKNMFFSCCWHKAQRCSSRADRLMLVGSFYFQKSFSCFALCPNMFEVDGCFSASMTHLIICYTQLSTEHSNGIVFPTCVYLFLD